MSQTGKLFLSLYSQARLLLGRHERGRGADDRLLEGTALVRSLMGKVRRIALDCCQRLHVIHRRRRAILQCREHEDWPRCRRRRGRSRRKQAGC